MTRNINNFLDDAFKPYGDFPARKDVEQVAHDKCTTPTERDSRFRASDLQKADLVDTKLTGFDFSMSALMGSGFDKSDLRSSKFKASALKGASFIGADLYVPEYKAKDYHER